MQKIAKLGLSILVGLVLSACGSGGGNSSNNAKNPPMADNTPKTNNPSPLNNIPSTSATGAALILTNQDANVVEKRVEINDPSTDMLNVDGKSIRVSYKNSGIYAGTWLNINGLHACCDKYSAVRFGIVKDGEKGYMFYNGSPTKSMPTSGTATYNGYALVTGNSAQFKDKDWLDGTSKFDVDFGTKKLSGTLNVDTLDAVNIAADISGNSFAGTANSAGFSTQAKVEGKFYGDTAKELGGMFKDNSKIGDDKAWGGVFGASQ